MSDSKAPKMIPDERTPDPALLDAAHRYAFTLVPNEHGGYYVDVPAFGDRIVTGGMTPQEAATNAVEAIALALDWYAARGQTPPAPTLPARAVAAATERLAAEETSRHE